MEAATSSLGQQSLRDTAAKLLRPANLRPLVTVLALFLLYPLTGVYNISFFAVSLFTRLGLGGAETVAVFTALVRCGGTLASTLLLLRSGGALQQHLTQCSGLAGGSSSWSPAAWPPSSLAPLESWSS